MNLTVLILWAALGASYAWNAPSPYQYHIQTDEGPERYFRYQTDSGQYRKEKRLADGTVVGTDGWVDASGYLRLKDYIADNEGYRILKSKTVFVGLGKSIQEAMKLTKNVKPQSGVLVNPGRDLPLKNYVTVSSYTPVSHTPTPTYPTPTQSYSTPTYPTSTQSYTTPGYPISVYVTPKSPFVEVSPNAIPYSPIYSQSTAATPIYHSSTTPRYESTSIESTTPKPIAGVTTPSPRFDFTPISSTSIENAVSSTPNSIPAINSNSVEQNYQYNRPRLQSYSPNNFQYRQPYNSYAAERSGPNYNYNQIGNGYDPQYPLYDGISVTNNGFRYYLPRQYHEEENSGSETRTGSFGYVDPFGIRRVIYYNTAPGTGFVHKKNNRYVGLNGTPYDPRPL